MPVSRKLLNFPILGERSLKTCFVKGGNDSSMKMMENQKESPESLESNFAITIEMLNC